MIGTGFVQLEHRGLHHINSLVDHMIISWTSIMSSNSVDDAPELMEESDDEDSENEVASKV